MSEAHTWDQWLAAEDAASPLAPRNYDDAAAQQSAKQLWLSLIDQLPGYSILKPMLGAYQDSTALVGIRISRKGDDGPLSDALAWVVASHFGRLATITQCTDDELLTALRLVLAEHGLQYIPYDYVAGKVYEGQCRGLRGLSWANRYFAHMVEFNEDFRPEDYL